MHVEHMCLSGYAHRVSKVTLWIVFLENSLSFDYFIIISFETVSLVEPEAHGLGKASCQSVSGSYMSLPLNLI